MYWVLSLYNMYIQGMYADQLLSQEHATNSEFISCTRHSGQSTPYPCFQSLPNFTLNTIDIGLPRPVHDAHALEHLNKLMCWGEA
jgi:hypothetical protein